MESLRALLNIIAAEVSTLEERYSAASLSPPCLESATFKPQLPAETLRLSDPAVARAIHLIVAATGQLAAAVRDPAVTLLNAAHAFEISSSMRVAGELNVVEILRDAGEQGLHVNDIAQFSGGDPQVLARVLRLLASHHIFREVSLDVFANNRVSAALDKGKSVQDLFSKPKERWNDCPGLPALVEFLADDCFKTSAYLADTIHDPHAAPGPIPHMRAFNTPLNMFQWFEAPEQEQRLRRFGVAMRGTGEEEPVDTILKGFDWGALPSGSTVVDVGGGIGTFGIRIAKAHPQLKIVTQDRSSVIEHAMANWKTFLPSAVKSGSALFQAHSFLEPQPAENDGTVSVFMMRQIVHDWPDDVIVTMLTHLRAVAAPTTKLLIVDAIVEPACAVSSAIVSSNFNYTKVPELKDLPIKGHAELPPYPLLANAGVAGAPLHYYDMTVNNLLGGGERTLDGFHEVCAKSGWKITSATHVEQTVRAFIVAEPI
ncbi:S-adenosyl-L-methionine-dependent methyltransferase [Mycena chlorophos]|uniref:S-adenosyl-L-methionine-dependent methyltransferase n=1 Tax=Mycena chlorophos TaxID=658473 RepID=A0A8H6WJS2_MYCCL|nr:S-adenosyl-L-methionine-dependent methyltransferase [Mycena chlorophos]